MPTSIETVSMRPKSARRRGKRLPILTYGSFAIGFSLLFCCMSVFEGAVRWIFSQADLEVLVYVRDVFLFLAAACGFVQAFQKGYTTTLRLVAVLAAVVLFWTLVGEHFDHNWLQSLFGLKTYLPIFAGVLTSRTLFKSPVARAVFWFLWIMAVMGVAVSAVTDMPWKGASYALGDEEIEGQREWTIHGVDRLAGFSRSSVEAAVQIALLGVVLMYSSKWPARMIVLIGSVGGIYLTTSRGELVALVLGGMTLAMCLSPWLKKFRGVLLPMPLLPASVVLLCMYFPAAVGFVGGLGSSGVLATDSFVARGEAIWKDAWDMQIHKGSVLMGRGIGGIGMAQRMYEPMFYNSADSNFVFMVVTFGVAAEAVFLLIIVWAWGSSLLKTPVESALPLACVAAWCGSGVTSNAVENAFLVFIVALNWIDPIMAQRKRLASLDARAEMETNDALLQRA